MTPIPSLLLPRVDSTLLEAERQAAAGRRGPFVVCAAEQTGGIGRHGRAWASPPGNIYWTILLDAEADRPRDAGLAFAAGLAVLDTLEALGAPANRLGLKWPNDLLLDGRKIAGVLAQTSHGGAGSHTIVGAGVNVATAPGGTVYPATAWAESGLPMPDLATLRDTLTRCFMRRRDAWHRDGLPPLRDAVAARLSGRGTAIRIARDRDRTEILLGINEGLDPSGALLLRTEDGRQHTIVAGDVLA